MRSLAERLAEQAAAAAGLSLPLIPAHSRRRALDRRLKATGLHAQSYEQRYAADAAEREHYLEELLTGETSFFRDAPVYAELRRWCLLWLAGNTGPLRILSAPCSTGEEPYSLAAMLLEAGVERERFRIAAVDLSAAALAQAQAGEYRGLALRNLPEPDQCWFLSRVADSWKVCDEVRRCVAFQQANLMDDAPFSGAEYDLISCRNLMIYQTPEARAHTAAVLARALAPGGRVVLGSADWCRELGEHFTLEQPVQSFALRARDAEAAPAKEPPIIAQEQPAPKLAPSPIATNALQLNELHRNALAAYLEGEEARAEWLCRQALYVDANHVATLGLLAKLHRPHLPARHRQALRARLKRAEGNAA